MEEEVVLKDVIIEQDPDQTYRDGLKQGKLLIQHCNLCGEYQFYPRKLCIKCGGTDLRWKESGGDGRIYTYTEVRRAPSASFAGMVPYNIALVDLEEGVRIMSWVKCADDRKPEVGMKVKSDFEVSPLGMAIPVFRPK